MKELASDPWEDLVDPVAIAGWLDSRGIGQGPVHIQRRLTGGTQNLLVLLSRGERRMVLRRPSRHPRPKASCSRTASR